MPHGTHTGYIVCTLKSSSCLFEVYSCLFVPNPELEPAFGVARLIPYHIEVTDYTCSILVWGYGMGLVARVSYYVFIHVYYVVVRVCYNSLQSLCNNMMMAHLHV